MIRSVLVEPCQIDQGHSQVMSACKDLAKLLAARVSDLHALQVLIKALVYQSQRREAVCVDLHTLLIAFRH